MGKKNSESSITQYAEPGRLIPGRKGRKMTKTYYICNGQKPECKAAGCYYKCGYGCRRTSDPKYAVSTEMTTYFVLGFVDDDDEHIHQYVVNDNDPWPFFREVGGFIAMADCTDEIVKKIVYKGEEFEYAGWKPGMEFTFINKNNPEDSYTTWLPEYNH